MTVYGASLRYAHRHHLDPDIQRSVRKIDLSCDLTGLFTLPRRGAQDASYPPPVFGTVTVRRLAYRAPGRPNVYPADAALSLPAGRHSHGLRRAAVREAVRGSCDTARAVIGARCGRVAGKRQIEELVQAAAAGISGFYARRVPVPCTSEVLLVLSADGKVIVMRPEGLRPATRKAAACKNQGRGVFRTRLACGEKPCRKRMATLACVYDAAAKWLTGSVARDAKEVIRAAFGQAEARFPVGPAHARLSVHGE